MKFRYIICLLLVVSFFTSCKELNDLLDSTPPIISNISVTTDEDLSTDIKPNIQNVDSTSSITFSVKDKPSHGSVLGSYPNIYFLPDGNFNGADQFTFFVSNENIASNEATAYITINPVNDSPIISGLPISEIKCNHSYSFTPSVIDQDDDQLTFSVENLPGWAAFNNTSGQLSGIPSNSDIGNYDNILISVFDGEISVELNTFNINVVENPWSTLSEMPTGRHAPAATSKDLKIYVSGGYNSGNVTTFEEYDISADSWTTKEPMQIARRGHSSHTIDNNVYVIGGEIGSALVSVEMYDIDTNSWTNKAEMNEGRSFHTSCLYDGKIYVFGGFTDQTHAQSRSTVEMYDPDTNTWSYKSSMSQNNWGMSCVVFNNKFYVIGGANNELGFDVYNPITDSWGFGGSLKSSKRYGFATSVVNELIYVLGGYNYSNVVEALDVTSGTWSIKSNINNGLHDMGHVTVGESIFIIGGRDNISNNLSTIMSYKPLLDQ